MRKRNGASGFTLIEIMIVVAIIALLAAIAIPNVLRGRTTANESAAIGNLRALVSSLEMYRSVYSVYPTVWQANMYDPSPSFGPEMFNKPLTPTSTIVVQGFEYRFDPATAQTYELRASVEVNGRTGTRSFFADEAGVIRHCNSLNDGDLAAVGNNTIDTTPDDCV